MNINVCPTCGSDRIRQVRRNLKGSGKGQSYTVRNLIFYECPVCEERVFDPAAMRRIEAASRAFAKPVRRTA
jgi:YgiT-type zinc finger domain-containing protein